MTKIQVKPEGREGIYLLSSEEAMKYIETLPDDQFHCFIGDFPVLIGADWSRQRVIECITAADRIAITIPSQMKHSLVTIQGQNRYLFDVGEITESMIETTKGG